MKIEGAALLPKHCKIDYNKDHHDYIMETMNEDAEVWVCINKNVDIKEFIKKDTDIVHMQCGSYKYEIEQSINVTSQKENGKHWYQFNADWK